MLYINIHLYIGNIGLIFFALAKKKKKNKRMKVKVRKICQNLFFMLILSNQF